MSEKLKVITKDNLSRYNDELYNSIGKQFDFSVTLSSPTDDNQKYQGLVKLATGSSHHYKFIIWANKNGQCSVSEVVINSGILGTSEFNGYAINSNEFYIAWENDAEGYTGSGKNCPWLAVKAKDRVSSAIQQYNIKVIVDADYDENWQGSYSCPEDPVFMSTYEGYNIPNISTKVVVDPVDSTAYTTEVIVTSDGTGEITAGDYIDYIIDNSADSSATMAITIKDSGSLKDGVYRFAFKNGVSSFTLTDGSAVTTYNETPIYKDGIVTYTKVTGTDGNVTASMTYDALNMYSSDLSIDISTDYSGKTDFKIGNKNLDRQYVGLDYSKYDDSWIYAPLTVFEAYDGTTNFTNQVLIKTKETSDQTYKDMVDLTDDNTVKSKSSSADGKVKYSATVILENSPAVYDMYQIIINSTLGEAHILKLTNGNNVLAEPFLAKYNNASNVYMYGIRIKDASVATLTAYSEKYGVDVTAMAAAGVYSRVLSESLEFGLLNRCCPMNGYIYSSFSTANWTVLDNINYNIKDVQNTAGTSLVDWNTGVAKVSSENMVNTLTITADNASTYLSGWGTLKIPVNVTNVYIEEGAATAVYGDNSAKAIVSTIKPLEDGTDFTTGQRLTLSGYFRLTGTDTGSDYCAAPYYYTYMRTNESDLPDFMNAYHSMFAYDEFIFWKKQWYSKGYIDANEINKATTSTLEIDGETGKLKYMTSSSGYIDVTVMNQLVSYYNLLVDRVKALEDDSYWIEK